MASDNTEYLRHHGDRLDTKVRSLLNSDLKAILKELGLQVSGNKSLLQERILDYVRRLQRDGDVQHFNRAHDVIIRHGSGRYLPLSDAQSNGYSQNIAQPPPPRLQHNMPGAAAYHHTTHSYSASQAAPQILPVVFKKSPFYGKLELLCGPKPLHVTNTGRATVHANVSLAAHQVERLRDSSRSWRVMAYCCYEQDHSARDITFPSQVELRCNTHGYSGNLRGIKKKPGTTKPADLTPFCTKAIGYNNQVSISYAGTEKRFLFSIYLVKVASVEELVEQVRTGQIISKQTVLNEMINKAKDPDIVATATIMSLKCPLSAMKMQLPCRSTLCNHNQCFDATSFLQLQEQAPQWSCPVCAKHFPFEALVIDQYVQDIIQRTGSSAEQVTVQPDGRWDLGARANDEFRMPSARPSEAPSNKRKADVLDVDGGVEIVSHQKHPSKTISASKPAPSPQAYPTPSFSASREPSAPASGSSRSGSKRPTDTIDLTLSSDDEDDEDDDPPRRPVKRQSTGNGLLNTTSELHSPSVSNYSNTPTSAPVDGGSRPPWMNAPYPVSAHSHSPGASTLPVPRHSASWGAQSQQYGSTFSGGYGAQNTSSFGLRR